MGQKQARLRDALLQLLTSSSRLPQQANERADPGEHLGALLGARDGALQIVQHLIEPLIVRGRSAPPPLGLELGALLESRQLPFDRLTVRIAGITLGAEFGAEILERTRERAGIGVRDLGVTAGGTQTLVGVEIEGVDGTQRHRADERRGEDRAELDAEQTSRSDGENGAHQMQADGEEKRPLGAPLGEHDLGVVDLETPPLRTPLSGQGAPRLEGQVPGQLDDPDQSADQGHDGDHPEEQRAVEPVELVGD